MRRSGPGERIPSSDVMLVIVLLLLFDIHRWMNTPDQRLDHIAGPTSVDAALPVPLGMQVQLIGTALVRSRPREITRS